MKSVILFFLFTTYSIARGDLRSDFNERVDAYLQKKLSNGGDKLFETQVLRLEFNDTDNFHPETIREKIDKLNRRPDGIDFDMTAMSWIFNKYLDNPLLDSTREDLIDAVLNLPFRLADEGELGPMQFWSENHQIGWKATQYLIGHAFATNPALKDKIFTASGLTGAQMKEVGKARVLQWLDYRSRFGFSEFNSDVYGPIAYRAILSLSGLAPDEEVKTRASMIQSLQEFDHILGSMGDRISTPRGRSYSESKVDDLHYEHLWLLKGHDSRVRGSSMSVFFVLNLIYGYQYPETLLQIANEVDDNEYLIRERFGLDAADGEAEGIGHDNAEDCIFWFGNGAYFPPETAPCFFVAGDEYNLWNRSETWNEISVFKPLWDLDHTIIEIAAQVGAPLGGGTVLGYANMLTYRNKDVMLSSVQEYHGGQTAGQQHPWQATLDIYRNGLVFSQQPISHVSSNSHSSKYWVGGVMPQVGQFGSTLIAVHNPEVLTTAVFGLNMTHAHFYFPGYDEVTFGDGWIFGRQGSSYVGLYSYHIAEFISDGSGELRDLVAPGVQNVWICEVGNEDNNGTFNSFVNGLKTSSINVEFHYEDSLVECLVDNQCLGSIKDLYGCLTGVCQEAHHLDTSETAKCISRVTSSPSKTQILLEKANIKEASPVLEHFDLASCLSERRSTVDVHYVRGSDRRTIDYGWDRAFVIDGKVVPFGNYPRYDNPYADVEWGEKQMEISAGGNTLYLDFESATMTPKPF